MKYKNFKKIKKNKGFVILFAVTLSAILLSIALSVTNIAQKEIKFGTSVKDANNAFFAADTGIECALFNDKAASTSFVESEGSGTVQCMGGIINIIGPYPSFNFIVSGLGSNGLSCANVIVLKETFPPDPSIKTTITSKGYNIGNVLCLSSNPDRIEREIVVSY